MEEFKNGETYRLVETGQICGQTGFYGTTEAVFVGKVKMAAGMRNVFYSEQYGLLVFGADKIDYVV